jgi:hypothetical protein
MSVRTVGWVVDEGGKYGEIQLAQEVMNAPGDYPKYPDYF